MKKLSTLFKKDPNDLGRVINEVNPENGCVDMLHNDLAMCSADIKSTV